MKSNLGKKIVRIVQNQMRPGAWQYGFLGLQNGDYVVLDVEEGKKGRFGYFYKPVTKEDLALVEEYKKKVDE